MAVTLPVSFDGEYRGRSKAGEFTNDEGELIAYADGLKFEYDLTDGDVGMIVIRQNKLDEVGTFDSAKLSKGDRVRIEGVARLGQLAGERSSFTVLAAAPIGQLKALRAA